VDTTFYARSPNESPREDFYLVVSALVPYKRIDQAVAACSRLGRRLVVIGKGPELARLASTAGPTVSFLGWQPDEIIRDHYRRCRALLFPGEEDFGIVPVEALACGAPVIALGRGGAAETVDDRVGFLYDHASTEALMSAIETWECAGCPHDPSLARERAEGYSAETFRHRILGFLFDVISAAAQPTVPPPFHLGRPRTTAGRETRALHEQ
jgi:glycosyltransferase involved in cell wall biosynthesis